MKNTTTTAFSGFCASLFWDLAEREGLPPPAAADYGDPWGGGCLTPPARFRRFAPLNAGFLSSVSGTNKFAPSIPNKKPADEVGGNRAGALWRALRYNSRTTSFLI